MKKLLVVFLSIVMFVIGGLAGAVGITYFTITYNEELEVSAEGVYSMSADSVTVDNIEEVEVKDGAVSVHFLELGNKYTGDCTYIKVGKDIDILIDCGSKASSVSTVSAYLNQYVTDGTLEYVIITHAHQDHYAGFATSEKVNSIFDLYDCKNIITFSGTNQKTSTAYIKDTAEQYQTSTFGIKSYASQSKSASTMYANFNRELADEIKNGAKHYTALDIINDTANFPNGEIVLDEANDISLQILNSYYYTNSASTENDYSVCTMLHQGEKRFIFTGDLEEKGEEYLVSNAYNPIFSEEDFSVEVYKAGHHGSKTSSTMTLLEVIRPRIVCVCCCAGSSEYTGTADNQFPTREFIINISQFTTQVYVTTLCEDYKADKFTSFNGNIAVVSTKTEACKVWCSNNTTLLKDTDWFKQNRLGICKSNASTSGQLLHESWYESSVA